MRFPVLRFVAVVTVLALGLLGLSWSGLAAPGMAASAIGEGTYDHGRTGYLTAELTNTGSAPVRVTSAAWASEGLADTKLLVGGPGGGQEAMRAFAPFTMRGGEHRTVMLLGRIHCPLPGDVVTVSTDPLRVAAKPIAGPERTRSFRATGRAAGMERTLPCPARS